MEIAREQLAETDEQIEAAFDALGYCCSADSLAYGLADELNNFRVARKSWTDPGRVETDEPSCIVIERCQAVRGQTRRDVVLIRFGEFCAIYGMGSD